MSIVDPSTGGQGAAPARRPLRSILGRWRERGYRGAPGDERRWVPSRRRSEERAFTARLLGTLLLTLLLVSGLGYKLRSGPLEDRMIADALVEVEAQAAALRHTYIAHDDRTMSLLMVEAVIEGIEGAPGVVEAALLDEDGNSVAFLDEMSHGGESHGEAMADGPDAAAHPDVAAIDDPQVRRNGPHAMLEFFVPVQLPEGRFVLHVARDRAAIEDQLAGLQRYSLLVVALGVPFGVVLFYLLGGRALRDRHRRALARSLRDGLTGLGNHRFYQDELRRAAAHASRYAEPLSLLLMDVDDFKRVNDSMGHGRGDQLLTQVAGLLTGIRADDRAFRVGGDEFSVILPGAGSEEARAAAERIRGAIEEHVSGATASIGVATSRLGEVNASDLYLHADLALYEAKHRGRNTVASFEEIDGADRVVEAGHQAALEALLLDGTVEPVFQPIWDLATGELIGHEALARFPADVPFEGPADAFAIAETLDRTAELDALCRARVLARVDRLPRATLLFLNVAPKVLGHPSIAGDRLVRQVRAAGLAPEHVVLEITEHGTIDRQLMAEEVARLRGQGFQVAIDDVGTGDAGLEVLGRVDVDYLKIDRSIIAGALAPSTARAVLLAVLAFGGATGAKIIAEGIESAEMLEFVRTLGSETHPGGVCAAQGYHLGMPASQPVLQTGHDRDAPLADAHMARWASLGPLRG